MCKSGKYVIIHFIAIDAADAEWPLGFGQRGRRPSVLGVRMAFFQDGM